MSAKLTWTPEELDALMEAVANRLRERIAERSRAYLAAEEAVVEAQAKAAEAYSEFESELERQGLELADVELPGNSALEDVAGLDFHEILGQVLAGIGEANLYGASVEV